MLLRVGCTMEMLCNKGICFTIKHEILKSEMTVRHSNKVILPMLNEVHH